MGIKKLVNAGYKPNWPLLTVKKGFEGDPGFREAEIHGRTAAKPWQCAYNGCLREEKEIPFKELHVEVKESFVFRSRKSVPPSMRYHLSCALAVGVILGFNRRAAIEAAKKSREERKRGNE